MFWNSLTTGQFTIWNTGNVPITVTNITVAHPSYDVLPVSPFEVAPDGKQYVTVDVYSGTIEYVTVIVYYTCNGTTTETIHTIFNSPGIV